MCELKLFWKDMLQKMFSICMGEYWMGSINYMLSSISKEVKSLPIILYLCRQIVAFTRHVRAIAASGIPLPLCHMASLHLLLQLMPLQFLPAVHCFFSIVSLYYFFFFKLIKYYLCEFLKKIVYYRVGPE